MFFFSLLYMSILVNIFENLIKFNDKNIFIIFDISGSKKYIKLYQKHSF